MMDKQKVIYVAAALGLIVLGASIWLLSTRSDSTSNDDSSTSQTTETGVTIRVAPTGSTLTINGQEVGEQTIELVPGTYAITASHDGFASQAQTITIKDGDHFIVGFALISNTDETARYYEFNPDEARKAEAIFGQKSEAVGVSRVNKLPLIKKLPKVEKGRYKISYDNSIAKPDDSSAVAIYVDYVDDSAKAAATNWIRYQGYDPATLEIIYRAVKGI